MVGSHNATLHKFEVEQISNEKCSRVLYSREATGSFAAEGVVTLLVTLQGVFRRTIVPVTPVETGFFSAL